MQLACLSHGHSGVHRSNDRRFSLSGQFWLRSRHSALLAGMFDTFAGPLDHLLPLHLSQSKIDMHDEFAHRGPGIQADVLGLDTDTARVEVHQRFQCIEHGTAESVDAGHHENVTLAQIVDGRGQAGPIGLHPTGGVLENSLAPIGL